MSTGSDLAQQRIFENFFPLPTAETLSVIGQIIDLPHDDIRIIAALNLGQASMGALGHIDNLPVETSTARTRHLTPYLLGAVLGELVARSRSYTIGVSPDDLTSVFEQLESGKLEPPIVQYPRIHTPRSCNSRRYRSGRSMANHVVGQVGFRSFFEDPSAVSAQLQDFSSLHTRARGCPRALEHGVVDLLSIYDSLSGNATVL